MGRTTVPVASMMEETAVTTMAFVTAKVLSVSAMPLARQIATFTMNYVSVPKINCFHYLVHKYLVTNKKSLYHRQCPPEITRGDGVCHAYGNDQICSYDGGDCCLAEAGCSYCYEVFGECDCHETGMSHCTGTSFLYDLVKANQIKCYYRRRNNHRFCQLPIRGRYNRR